MQACVCGLKGAPVSFCFFSDAMPKVAKKTTAKKVMLYLIMDAIALPIRIKFEKKSAGKFPPFSKHIF